MRILAGSVVRQDAEVLAAHLKTMLWQETDADVDFVYVNDLDPDAEDYKESSNALFDSGVDVINSPMDQRPSGAEYVAGEQTHHWTEPTFSWLGHLKQGLLDKAVAERYDAVFLADSDLLMDPRTLQSLIDANKPIVSAVFWTAWQRGTDYLPQVWLRHPYGLEGRGMSRDEFLLKLASRELTRVWGLGACTLIRTDVLDRVRYAPLLQGLPQGGMWQGEDRSFCIRAERAHIEMWADPWPDVWHCYRPSDREQIDVRLAQLSQVNKPVAGLGDWASFAIEPLEEEQLKGATVHKRGRVGTMRILPEIEYHLMHTGVGDDAVITLAFPPWYELEPYRKQDRVVRLRVMGAKGNHPPPNLERRYAVYSHRAIQPHDLIKRRQGESITSDV